MSLPTYDQFIEPILRFLASCPEGATAKEAHEAAAQGLALDDVQRAECVSSGQSTYKNRAGWAHDRLKRAGLSSSIKRGLWQLTDEGRAFVAANPQPLTPQQVAELASAYNNVILKAAGDDEPELPLPVARSVSITPEERLAQALQELREAVAIELLESLKQVSPTRFEHIVLDVLHALGYGSSRADLQQVGGSGDGGIDGVISLDRLGLEKVYVQAKRWQSAVGRPELQAFYGALAAQKSRRGVFITTSGYTTQAREFATSVEGIVLVDGLRLVNLMMDHEVGVSSRSLRLPKLDSDYFED